ncbi:MAG: hypothetical protein QOH06_616 [Acidobacteriota bacterium]|jgi:hypothetical protein|nr:hypothetical protein [Acidobacteriota bacterium]
MSNGPSKFVDDLVAAMEQLGKQVEAVAARFLEAILRFLDDAARWIERVVRRIIEYAAKFLPAFGRLSLALFKLSLFYAPSLLALLFGASRGSVGWIFIALVYAAFITVIGLSYGRSTRAKKQNP